MAKFKHIASGTPRGKSPANSASWLNAVSDATAHYKNQVEGGSSSGPKPGLNREVSIIKVKNLIPSTDLVRGHYVQIGESLLDEVDHRNLWFCGEEFADANDGKIAILRQALKADEIGDAQIIGVCTAVVNVTDIGHRFAKPVDGDHVFESADGGVAEILGALTETGEQEVAVSLGGFGGQIDATITAAIIKGTVPPAGLIDIAPPLLTGDQLKKVADFGLLDADPPRQVPPVVITTFNSGALLLVFVKPDDLMGGAIEAFPLTEDIDGSPSLMIANVVNPAFTAFVGGNDGVAVMGSLEELEGHLFFFLPTDDMRALPGFDENVSQAPFNVGKAFELGRNDCT